MKDQSERRCDRCGKALERKGESARAMVQVCGWAEVPGNVRWGEPPVRLRQRTTQLAPAKMLCTGCAQGAQDALDAYVRGE